MKSFLGKVNKTVTGHSRRKGSSGASNSETDSETLKALSELNQRLKDRKIKAKLVTARNSLFIRGTFTDQTGIRKERKIPTRLATDINNLVSAEARILQLLEYVNKNGFIPDVLMWDAPKINPVITSGGLTIGEAVKTFEIDYWKDKKRTSQKENTFNLAKSYMDRLPEEAELTIELLLDYIINDTEPESKTRDQYAQQFKKLCVVNDIAGIRRFDPFLGKYKPKARTKKDENKLLELMELVRPNKNYGWIICSQYVYGTRISETLSLIPNLKTGTATSVCIPKGGKENYIKYPIALTNELAIKWKLDNIERPYSYDLGSYDPKSCKRVGNHLRRWLEPRAKEVGLEGLQPTDIRHDYGVRSILADMEMRTASKAMGHDPKTHSTTYTQTYEEIDAIKQAKKLKK